MIHKTALKPGDHIVLPVDVPDLGMPAIRVTVDTVDFSNNIADVACRVHPNDQALWGDWYTEFHTSEYPETFEEWE